MTARRPEPVFIERYFGDGRRAEVVEVDGRIFARVYTATGRIYLEHDYENIGEATTTVMLWNGDGWPLSEKQRRDQQVG